MSRIKWKGAALLSPMPAALISCGTMETPNALTVSWTGIINSQPPKTYISVRESRFSYGIIKASGEFVINLTTPDMTRGVDYCGVKSGRDRDKLKEAGFSVIPSFDVSAPSIQNSPLSLECRVFDVIKLGSHDMFLADILTVSVDEKYVDEKGKLNLKAAGLLCYSHGEYFELGKKTGKFGYSVRKKK